MKECYLFPKASLQWDISPEKREAMIETMMSIVLDPNASNRARNIAAKNLLNMNAQNIQIVKDDNQPAQDLKITIIEDKA